MYDEFTDWVKAALPAYTYRHGQWEETDYMAATSLCSIHALGGPSPDVDDRRPRFRVILLGPRNNRGAAQQTKNDIYALAQAALDGIAPCGAAAIRAMGEPSGPGYTTENRAWWSLDFQITY
ncbi:hypothetical protein NJI34_41630 [Pseudomonas sp. S 311-6]|nr:hypothetical protein [Pseudomonas sp. S 311-6]